MADDTVGSRNWAPVQRVRSYEQVMNQIEEQILDGRLKSGDRLPSERDLALLLGVSRPTLRESLRVLEALGIIDIRPGGGSDGGAVLSGSLGSGFLNLLKLQLALGQFSSEDMLNTRLALESWAVSRAAYVATESDHADLSRILDSMDSTSIEAAEFNALDAQFHVRIAESTGNALIAHLMRSMRIAINRQMVQAYAQLKDWRETAKVVRSEHRGILDALVRRAPEEAQQLVREHITHFYQIEAVRELLLPDS